MMSRGWLWLILACAVPLAAEPRGPVAWWRFDEGTGAAATDAAAHITDSIRRNARFVPGVSGSALKLDGFTAYVERESPFAPRLSAAFTVEAWIAIQEYPLNFHWAV